MAGVPAFREPTSGAADRLRLAFELFELSEALLRQKLRRTVPGISEEEVELRVGAWLASRPGAEAGDSAGRPVAWPRRAR